MLDKDIHTLRDQLTEQGETERLDRIFDCAYKLAECDPSVILEVEVTDSNCANHVNYTNQCIACYVVLHAHLQCGNSRELMFIDYDRLSHRLYVEFSCGHKLKFFATGGEPSINVVHRLTRQVVRKAFSDNIPEDALENYKGFQLRRVSVAVIDDDDDGDEPSNGDCDKTLH